MSFDVYLLIGVIVEMLLYTTRIRGKEEARALHELEVTIPEGLHPVVFTGVFVLGILIWPLCIVMRLVSRLHRRFAK